MMDMNRSNQQRHRPPPLPLNDRAHLLNGLRTARGAPTASTVTPDPLTQLQQAQNDYLHQLQRQIQHQSQMLLLQQQQAEANAALLAMQGARGARVRSSSAEPTRSQVQPKKAYPEPPRSAFVTGSFLTSEEEQAAASTNPLVASALARRKRQSLNSEALRSIQAQGETAAGRRASESATEGIYHRRQSSTETAVTRPSQHTSSPPPSSISCLPSATVDPPALILSQPGEAYPATSGSEGDDDADSASSIKSKPNARRYSVHTSADLKSTSKPSSTASSSPDLAAEGVPPSESTSSAPSRRRSHVNDLNLALSGRKQRPASVGGPFGLGSPSLSGGSGGFGDQQQQQGRSGSDTAPLSPFAASFTPLPPSPFVTSPRFDFSPSLAAFSPQMYAFSPPMPVFSPPLGTDTYQSNRPAPVSGTASAIRQPRGPASDFAGNFSARLRKQAVATLLGSRVGRSTTGGDPLVGEVMGLGVEGVDAAAL